MARRRHFLWLITMLDSRKKNAIVCGVGNVVVWYNYSLFMPFFLILSKNFLPVTSGFWNMLCGFAIFGLGLFSRPIGSYLFGRIGDKISREKAIGYALCLMSFSTVSMAIIPSYETIGFISTILLIIARTLQGIAMGGAASISIVHLVELFSEKHKCLGGSLSQVGMILGLSLGSLMHYITPFINEAFGISWGWKIAFYLGIGLIPFSHFNMSVQSKNEKPVPAPSTLSAIKQYKRQFLTVMLLTAFAASCFYILFAFLPNYLMYTYPTESCFILHIVNIIMLVTIPIAGLFGDKLSRISILATGITSVILGTLLTFAMLSGRAKVEGIMIVLCLSIGIFYGANPAFSSEVFPKEIRCTAVALAMSISQAIFGGIIPMVATTLTKYSFDLIIFPIMLVACFGLSALYLVRTQK